MLTGLRVLGLPPFSSCVVYRAEYLLSSVRGAIGEGNGNPLQCSCLENPRDRGAWWAAVCGVAQSRTRLKQLSSSSSSSISCSRTELHQFCPLLRHQQFLPVQWISPISTLPHVAIFPTVRQTSPWPHFSCYSFFLCFTWVWVNKALSKELAMFSSQCPLNQFTLGFASSVSRNCPSQGEPRTSRAAKSILGTFPHLAFRSPHSMVFLLAHQLLLSLLHGFFLISLPSLMLNAVKLRFWQLPLSSPSLEGGLIFILMTLSRNYVFDSPRCISNSEMSPEL